MAESDHVRRRFDDRTVDRDNIINSSTPSVQTPSDAHPKTKLACKRTQHQNRSLSDAGRRGQRTTALDLTIPTQRLELTTSPQASVTSRGSKRSRSTAASNPLCTWMPLSGSKSSWTRFSTMQKVSIQSQRNSGFVNRTRSYSTSYPADTTRQRPSNRRQSVRTE
ncbi:hypothetical protein KCU89_g107, partial [Aureobasidium melanogenum]